MLGMFLRTVTISLFCAILRKKSGMHQGIQMPVEVYVG